MEEQLSIFNNPDISSDTSQFFEHKRAWSAAKHRIMLKYIHACCYNLGGPQLHKSRNMNYIDGFSGEGSYTEGIGIEDFIDNSQFWRRYDSEFEDTDGSPLIALKLAKIFREEKRVNLRCFFVEGNNEFHKTLEKNVQAFEDIVDYKIYPPQDFSEALPYILNDIGQYPSIFFLDSFGVKGINFSQIKRIGNYLSKNKGELFLLFHNVSVARSAGFLTQASEKPRMIKTAQSYMDNLTQLLGDGSELAWKQKWLELKDKGQEFERWALHYFKQQILDLTDVNGVASYEIKENYTDVRPKYSIVACSNYPPKAFGHFLNDFFHKEDKSLFYQIDSSGKNKKFLDDAWTNERQRRIRTIYPELISILKKTNLDWMIFDDVITTIILNLENLGILKRSDYRAILIDLFQNNIIEAEAVGKRNVPTLKHQIRFVQ